MSAHLGPSRERERDFLFNDAPNTFYLRLYGIRHMVKDHSDSEKGNPLWPHRLLLSINSKGSFICTIPQTGYHGLWYTSSGALAGTRNTVPVEGNPLITSLSPGVLKSLDTRRASRTACLNINWIRARM